jgi:hypothetical protein
MMPVANPVLEFAAFRRDGVVEWRLQCAGPFVTVNCSAYTRWDSVWGRASKYLSFALNNAAEKPFRVESLLLQYIDLFFWSGAREDYDLGELLNLESPMFPPSMAGRGALWHLHQGWFVTPSPSPYGPGNLPSGRALERPHIDSFEAVRAGEPTPSLHVRIDDLIRYDLAAGLEGQGIFDDLGPGLACFESMHHLNKVRLAEFLTKGAAEEIGLSA